MMMCIFVVGKKKKQKQKQLSLEKHRDYNHVLGHNASHNSPGRCYETFLGRLHHATITVALKSKHPLSLSLSNFSTTFKNKSTISTIEATKNRSEPRHSLKPHIRTSLSIDLTHHRSYPPSVTLSAQTLDVYEICSGFVSKIDAYKDSIGLDLDTAQHHSSLRFMWFWSIG